MPIFYMHLFNDTQVTHDDTGRDFSSDEIALSEAARAIAGVLADELMHKPSPITLRLTVERADGSHAGTLEVVARVDRAG